MAQQHILNFLDGNVFATSDDNVLGATGHPDISVGIAPGAVAGLEPAVGREALLGEGSALDVANEHVRAASEQVALLPRAKLRAGRVADTDLHFRAAAPAGTSAADGVFA